MSNAKEKKIIIITALFINAFIHYVSFKYLYPAQTLRDHLHNSVWVYMITTVLHKLFSML